MNVGQLKAELAEYPDDMQIILSQDEEGNGFSPLYDVAESMWAGEYDQTYVPDEFIGTQGYTEEDRAPEDAVKVLVLWP